MSALDQAFRDAHIKAERFNGHGANVDLLPSRTELQVALDALDALDAALDAEGEAARSAKRRWAQHRRERVLRLLGLEEEA